jgi:PAS domain S-box-containing protein
MPVAHSKDLTSAPASEVELLEQVHDAINATDANGVLNAWNAGCERLYGYSAEEALGRNVEFLLFPEDVPYLVHEVFAPLAVQDVLEMTVRNRRKDGTAIFVALRLSVVRDASGAIQRIIGCSNDITERKKADDALRRQILERRRAEDALRASELKLNHLLLRSPAVLFSLDPSINYTPTFISENVESIFGYPSAKFVRDLEFWRERVHPDDFEPVWAATLNLTPEATAALEYRFLHADGAYRHVRVTLVGVGDHEGRLVELVGHWVDVTPEKRSEELRREQDRLRLFAEELLKMQDAVRKRISRELHDDLNQRLATVILEIGLLEKGARNASLRSKLSALKTQAAKISDEVRRIALELHTAGLDQFGLPAVLEQECADLSARTGIQVQCLMRCAPASLPESVALALYRVAQECLRNIVKHSQSDRIVVTLGGTHSEVTLTVQDWGVGFVLEEARTRRSLGLVIMGERIRQVGGTIEIRSTPGQGTKVEARIPLAKGDSIRTDPGNRDFKEFPA